MYLYISILFFHRFSNLDMYQSKSSYCKGHLMNMVVSMLFYYSQIAPFVLYVS